MSAFFRFSSLEEASHLPARPLHLAIGMFDGVHLGHRAVIDAAIQSARRCDGLAAVLTFWPHPSELFRPNNPTKLIMSAELKVELLERAGVDVVIVQRFTPEFSRIEPESFLSYLRRSLTRLTTVYVGENWRFGRGRRGDISLLIVEARKLGLSVVSAPRINLDGEPISSTRIRSYLEAGEIDKANALLGYTYFAEGVVTPGKGLGRKLQFPTLNLSWKPELCPRFGVYAVKVSGQGAGSQHVGYPAVANFGLRPTVENSTEPRLEAHLLGESCPFQAGDPIRVEWLTFLRPEEKFPGLGALTAQIGRDREAAERLFLEQREDR